MEPSRYFGYLCPKCGVGVIAGRTVFSLQAAAARMQCECGESELRVETDGVKFRLWVPCGICGGAHSARCSPERMLRGATALGCSDTKQFCCFIGDEGIVEKNLRELTVLVQKERAQKDSEDPEAFLDSVIMYEVLSELKEIAERPNGITCGCGSSHYGMQIRRSAVDLTCKDCGAKLRIPAATDRDLDDLCCHIKLVIPGKQA